MNDYDFVLWVCLWPLTCTIARVIEVNSKNKPYGEISERAKDVGYLAEFVIWIVVGAILRG